MGKFPDEKVSMPIFKKIIKSNFFKGGVILLVVGLLFWFSIPPQLFNTPYATVITDANGELLGAHIADDGQWRFPPGDSVPVKFKTAILTFEDEYFYHHP